MAQRPAAITKREADNLFRAARAAGWKELELRFLPNGEVRCVVKTDCRPDSAAISDWDEVLEE